MEREFWRSDSFARYIDSLSLKCPCCRQDFGGENAMINSPFVRDNELLAPTLPSARVYEVNGNMYGYPPLNEGYPVVIVYCVSCGHMSLFDLTITKNNYMKFLATEEGKDEKHI